MVQRGYGGKVVAERVVERADGRERQRPHEDPYADGLVERVRRAHGRLDAVLGQCLERLGHRPGPGQPAGLPLPLREQAGEGCPNPPEKDVRIFGARACREAVQGRRVQRGPALRLMAVGQDVQGHGSEERAAAGIAQDLIGPVGASGRRGRVHALGSGVPDPVVPRPCVGPECRRVWLHESSQSGDVASGGHELAAQACPARGAQFVAKLLACVDVEFGRAVDDQRRCGIAEQLRDLPLQWPGTAGCGNDVSHACQ
jgi:hypothetical protein